MRGQAVGDFALHHEHDGVKVSAIGEQAQQDVGGDEVGKIADHAHLFRLVVDSRTRASGLGSEERVEIDGENVALDDLDVRSERKLHAQLGGQNAIEFDGDQPPGAPGEQGSQGAASGADFEHRALGEISEGLGDAQCGGGVGEKMLAQFGCSGSWTRGRYFRHVDPLSFGRLHWTFTPRIFVRRSGVQQ